MHLATRLRLTVLGAVWIGAATASLAASPQAPDTNVWPTQRWSVATPEEHGMDSSALAALVDFGAAHDMDSIVVTRHGKLVAEAYYAPFKPGMRHRMYSATKAVVGMLTGIAIEQGKLKGTDQSVVSFFDESKVANADGRKKAVTVQNLLDMTSGIEWAEPLRDGPPQSMQRMMRSGDWPKFVLDQPMAQEPGSGFNYNSGGTHVLAAILSRKTGTGVDDYAVNSIFQPLGIADYKWDKDPQGLAIGGWGLYLQTRDMAKLGYLYLRGGAWEGTQVVPHDWVNRVYAAKVPMNLSPNEDWRYGDLWWTLPARQAYMMVGYHSQIILVMPKTDVVVAVTGQKYFPVNQMLDLLAQTVKSETALPPNPTATAALQRRVLEAATEPTQVITTPEIAQRISGKTYKMAGNPLGIKELTLHLGEKAETASYDIVSYAARGSTDTKKTTRPLGLNGQFSQPDAATPGSIVSKGVWSGPTTLAVVVRRLEDAESERFVVEFSGDKVAINYSNDYGFQMTMSGEASN